MARLKKIEISRLRDSIGWNRRALGFHRQNRKKVLDKYGGPGYGEGSNKNVQPINLIELGLTTYATQLVPDNPRASTSTYDQELEGSATLLKLSLDQLAEELDLAGEIEECVMNANCGLGIMQVGLSMDPTENTRHERTLPFAEAVSFDDWVHDTGARKVENCQYYGHQVSLVTEEVMDHPDYPQHAKNEALRTSRSERGRAMDDDGDLASSLSHGSGYSAEGLYDMIDCWNLYFPRENYTMLLPVDAGKPLMVSPWTGHRGGPYRFLKMGRMPDNIMGVAPGVSWLEQNKFINNVWGKLQDQAEREKTVLTYRDEASRLLAQRIADAKDSALVFNHDPNKIDTITIPGVNQSTFAFALNVLDRWAHDAGNIDLLGGLGAQSDTLGQDQLLANNASSRMNFLKTKVNKFIGEVFEALAFEIMADPYLSRLVEYQDPDADISIPVQVTHRDLKGTIRDYRIKVEPYSQHDQSPEEKIQFLLMVYERIVMPAMGAGMVDQITPLVQLIGTLRNMPEIQKVFGGIMPTLEMATTNQAPMKPNFTRREEIRRSVPQMTPRGHSQNLQTTMMTANNNMPSKAGAGVSQ